MAFFFKGLQNLLYGYPLPVKCDCGHTCNLLDTRTPILYDFCPENQAQSFLNFMAAGDLVVQGRTLFLRPILLGAGEMNKGPVFL